MTRITSVLTDTAIPIRRGLPHVVPIMKQANNEEASPSKKVE